MKRLSDDPEVELLLIVTGMHLSPEFGLSYKHIEQDGFAIHKKLEILLSSDSPAGITKSIGIANIAFADAYEDLKPDLLVLLGDRFEIFAAATAALVARIPVAHCHGGEVTEGAIDDAFRHSITKMAHIHFTATEEYKERVIQLGENPDTVYNVGGLGIESINRLSLLEREDFEKSIGFKLKKHNLLITFHPVTLESSSAERQFAELLKAVAARPDTGLIFTLPNADTDGRIIIDMIKSFVQHHADRAIAFASLGQLRYISALRFVDAVVGNSSSGLIEAPSFNIGTINIGDRQKGRLKAQSVIDCEPNASAIEEAFKKLYSSDFQNRLKGIENPYGKGSASEKICEVLKNTSLKNLVKKSFYKVEKHAF
jgi:GDP/UDP-N,N'-diacetylbacillosamine 2-epimerase (hydrolysing)